MTRIPPHRLRLVVCITLLSFSLAAPLARASDATVKTRLAAWSHRIGVDAHSVQLAASRRHPRRLTYSARRFRADALRARGALSTARPSSLKGRQAQKLALRAFTAYAAAGREWNLTGLARLQKQRSLAVRHAALGARYAKDGNRLLLAASKLIR